MAIFSAVINNLGGMSSQVGVGTDRLFPAGLSASYGDSPPAWSVVRPNFEDLEVFSVGSFSLYASSSTGTKAPAFATVRQGALRNESTCGANWFEDVHVIPRSLELGNIISDQQFNFSVFNGYRYDDKTFNSLALNAGAGITTSGLASLPTTLQELDTSEFTLLVDSDGASTINGTLDFVVSGVSISVPITGARVVMFPYPPEKGYTEELEFLTDVIERMDGTEQRISLRDRPRHTFDFLVRREDGIEKQRIANLMFDWQSQLFGLPIWHEAVVITADLAIGATATPVDNTDYSDFKVGDLAIVFQDETTFDALTVDTVTSTSVTYTSPTNFAFNAGDTVMPIKLSFAEPTVSRTRPPVGYEDFRVIFKTKEQGSDLSDTAAFSTYSTKVLLDGPNVMDGNTSSASLRRKVSVLDSTTGLVVQSSAWDRGKNASSKGFLTKSRQELWEARGLVHALRGQQTSFFMPTFAQDITPTQNLSSGGTTMEIVNGGYSRFVNARVPHATIRVLLTDGTSVLRDISSSTAVDADTEQLTIASGWPGGGILLTDIARVDFIEKVRMGTDKVKIVHKNNAGHTSVKFATVTVFE